jgi:hypothetical protein
VCGQHGTLLYTEAERRCAGEEEKERRTNEGAVKGMEEAARPLGVRQRELAGQVESPLDVNLRSGPLASDRELPYSHQWQ